MLHLLSVSDEKWLWHKRLRHYGWRLISKLIKLKLVKDLSKLKYHLNALCGAWQKGKIAKTSFKTKNIVSTSSPWKLLHVDHFRLISTTSINGKKYRLFIVDDCSRWIWVNFLETKDEAYDVFSNFCTWVQNEKNWKF